MKERKVLGRGIASLIPNPNPPTSKSSQETRPSAPVAKAHGDVPHKGIAEVNPKEIRTNPRQPRKYFSTPALAELTESIRRFGVLEPLLVRKVDGGYELIAGERRLRAVRNVGLASVPVIVRSGTDQEQLEIALIENLQREDLNPIEEARGYDQLAKEFFLTQEEIAKRVGKDRATITNMLRVLKLPTSVQDMIATGAIAMGHARAILPLDDQRRQEELAQKIEKEDLSVRQVESLIRQMLPKPKKGRRATDAKGLDPNLRHLSEELQRVLGTRIDIQTRGKGGEIRIRYYGADDFKRISNQLLGGTGK